MLPYKNHQVGGSLGGPIVKDKVGDNWRVNDQLALNYGVRWDVDWGVASPPDVITNSIPINNRSAAASTNIPDQHRNPYTWQSSIGFQKQINQVTGFELDLTHFNEYRDTRTIDPNLFSNPATGYNQSPAAINGVANRPNTACTQIAYFVSTGHRDQTQASMALNRRFKQLPERRHLHAHVVDARRRQHRVHGAGSEQPVRLYITDNDNNRIVRINDMSGAGWVTYGSYGKYLESGGPKHLAGDRSTVAASRHCRQRFDEDLHPRHGQRPDCADQRHDRRGLDGVWRPAETGGAHIRPLRQSDSAWPVRVHRAEGDPVVAGPPVGGS